MLPLYREVHASSKQYAPAVERARQRDTPRAPGYEAKHAPQLSCAPASPPHASHVSIVPLTKQAGDVMSRRHPGQALPVGAFVAGHAPRSRPNRSTCGEDVAPPPAPGRTIVSGSACGEACFVEARQRAAEAARCDRTAASTASPPLAAAAADAVGPEGAGGDHTARSGGARGGGRAFAAADARLAAASDAATAAASPAATSAACLDTSGAPASAACALRYAAAASACLPRRSSAQPARECALAYSPCPAATEAAAAARASASEPPQSSREARAAERLHRARASQGTAFKAAVYASSAASASPERRSALPRAVWASQRSLAGALRDAAAASAGAGSCATAAAVACCCGGTVEGLAAGPHGGVGGAEPRSAA